MKKIVNGTIRMFFLFALIFCASIFIVSSCSAKNYGTFQLNQLPNAPSNPICESQVNPTKILSTTPTFGWTFSDPDGGDTQGGFNIIVGTTSGGDTLWNYTTTVTTSTQSVVYAGSALSAGVTYHWKVRTNDTYEATKGVFCADQTFKINALPTTTASTPVNDSLGVELKPVLAWNYVDADSDAQTNYHIQVSKYSAFNSTVIDVNATSSQWQYNVTSSLTKNTQYYWRVKTKDGYQWGSFTGWSKFKTTNISVYGLQTFSTGYVKTSSFNIGNLVIIRYNVTNVQNMNNTYLTITDPLSVKRIDHQGVASVQDAFANANNWDEDYPTRWNIATGTYQHGQDGGSGQYNARTLVKTSVLANQTNLTVQVRWMVDFSNEDMQRIIVRYKDANNYVAAYASETYSVIGVEERVSGVRYFEETSRLFSEDTWYTMKLVLEGETAKVYSNDVLYVTKTRLTSDWSGRMGLGTDTGWVYFDDYAIGYPGSRVVGAITDGYQYEYNYTIPNNASLGGTWNVQAYAESGGEVASNSTTFNAFSASSLISNITTYNSTYAPTVVFINGQKVVIRSWVSDSYGRTAITECNITIKNSLGTTKVDKADMVDVGDITNGNIYEYNYTIPHEAASDGVWNVTVKVNNNRSNAAIKYGSFEDDVAAPIINPITTYTSGSEEKTVFALGEVVKVQATVTDLKGRDNLTECKLTLKASNGTTMLSNVSMADIGNVTNGNIYSYEYTLPSTENSYGTWEISIWAKDYYYNTITKSNFIVVWADTNYYHRQKLTLTEQFNVDREHEPLGFSVTLPTSVCGGANQIKIVNEKGIVMPFKIQKTSGTTYYITFVANISASSTADYYLYYNVTGSAPSMYTTYDIASYDNMTLEESNYIQWYESDTENITYGKAVTVRELTGDSKPEIIWVGRTGPGGSNKAFMKIYNATFSAADEATMTLLDYEKWNNSGSGEGFAYSVNTSDVDNDGTVEIIVGGTVFDGTRLKAQLTIWNFIGGTLTLETTSTWYANDAGTSIFGVITKDADGDGVKEILTAGTTGTTNARGQFAVHNYTNGNIRHEYFSNWSLSGNTYNWTEFYAIVAGDIYNDGGCEVIVGGDSFADGGKINAVFKVYRYYSGAWHVDDTQNWAQLQLSEVFSMVIGDVNGDGKNEWITSGNYFDGVRDVAQYRVWNATGAGYPKTLGEITSMRQDWYVYGYSSALTVMINDIDNNSLNEIVTVGFQNDNIVDRGDYKIRYWDGTTTRELYTQLWSHEYARRSGDFFDAAYIIDLNNDGYKELIDTGRYALTPPAGTYLRIQTVGGVKLEREGTTDNHGEVLPPLSPTALARNGTARTSTSLGITWTKGSAANTTLVVYKKGSYPTSITDGTVAYNGSGTVKTITGLDPGTKYYFALWSWRNGSGAYSGVPKYSNDSTNPGAPTSFDAKNPTSSSIGLEWVKGVNSTTTYIVRKTVSYPTNIADGTFIYNDTGTTTTDSNGLSHTTQYFYKAWSFNAVSGYFSSGNATDSETTSNIAPTIATLDASDVEETTATLAGTVSDDGGAACTAGFYYSTSSGGTTNNVSATGTYATGNSFDKAISGLTKGELYYVSAWGLNSGGFTKAANEKKFLTKPEAPTSLGGTPGYVTIGMTWTEANCGLGETVGTRVQFKTGSSPTSISDGTNAYNDTGESGQASGLAADTHYYFSAWAWVRAESNDVFQWSDTYDTWDAWTYPAPPQSLNLLQALGNYSLNISWTKYDNNYRTVVLRNASGWANYPSSVTNGTVIYNNTGTWYIDTTTHRAVTYYYSAWSFNTTSLVYSSEHTTAFGAPSGYTLDISVAPLDYDFGEVAIGSVVQTTGGYFTFTNIGITADVKVTVNNSVNWTFVNLSDRGHNKFAMNYSGDGWSTQSNILTTGLVVAQDVAENGIFTFDIKLFTPTSLSKQSHKEKIYVTITATPS